MKSRIRGLTLLAAALSFAASAAAQDDALLRAVFDGKAGVDGISGATSVALTPDGSKLYAVGATGGLAVFSRDDASGKLTFVESWFDKSLDPVNGLDNLAGPHSVTVAPDGLHVYVTALGDDAVLAFAQNFITGGLTFVEDYVAGVDVAGGLLDPKGIVVSIDGVHVYVAGSGDDSVVVFSRAIGTGELTFLQQLADGSGGVDGLDNVNAVALSSDGRHVYTASGTAGAGTADNAVAVFSRDSMTGLLSFDEVHFDGVDGVDGLAAASSVALSLDGLHLNTAAALAADDDWLAVFSRDPADGSLTFVESHLALDLTTCLVGQGVENRAVVSPDGALVYASLSRESAVVIFARDAGTGALTAPKAVCSGIGAGLFGVTSVALEPGGVHLYAAAPGDDAVATVGPAIFADGFESGDTAAWSVSVP